MTAPDTAAIRARSQQPGYQEGQELRDVLAPCDAYDTACTIIGNLCDALDEAAKREAALEAEIKRLTKECDCAQVGLSEMRRDRDRQKTDARQWKSDARKAQAETNSVQVENERLKQAVLHANDHADAAIAALAPQPEDQKAAVLTPHLKHALWLATRFAITRYLLAVSRYDGAEKAVRHRELCDHYVVVFRLGDPDAIHWHASTWDEVHTATQALTDHLDTEIGFDRSSSFREEWIEKFFSRFNAIACATLGVHMLETSA